MDALQDYDCTITITFEREFEATNWRAAQEQAEDYARSLATGEYSVKVDVDVTGGTD